MLEVLPPRLAPGWQPGTFGFSNSLSLDPLSVFLTGRIPPAELPTAKTRGKHFLCFRKWPSALDKVLIPSPKSCTEGWKICRKRTQWTISVQECNKQSVYVPSYQEDPLCPSCVLLVFYDAISQPRGCGAWGVEVFSVLHQQTPCDWDLSSMSWRKNHSASLLEDLRLSQADVLPEHPFPPENKQGKSWDTLF